MDKRAISEMARRTDHRNQERGFSIVQLAITVAIASIVSVFALVGLARAREHVRLQTSVRQLASYIEKARLDAVRRHSPATVVFSNPSTYTVTMDFDGTGTVADRSFSLESGVTIISSPLPSLGFDWRGRTSTCTITFALQNGGGDQSWVDVSDAGDVTVNSDVDVLPTVSYTNVNSTADVMTGSVISGNGLHNNVADCGGGGGGGVTPPPITGTGAGGCTMTGNPSALTIKKGGGSSGSVTLSTTGSSTYTITPSGPSNLSISPTSKTISAGGSTGFSISSLNKTRGTFAINFSSSCTTVTVSVKVVN